MGINVNEILNMAKNFLPEKYKNKVDSSIQTVSSLFQNNGNNFNSIINEARRNGFSSDFVNKLKPYTSNPVVKSILGKVGFEGNQVNNILDEFSSKINEENKVEIPSRSGSNDISKLTNALNKIKKNY